MAIACLTGALSIASVALASSGAGTLDRSFGAHGKVRTRFAFRSGHPRWTFLPRANAVLTDSRHRLVAVGTADHKFALARYKPDGRLDRSFSENGKVKTQLGTTRREPYSKAFAGATDSHGRIVAAGFATGKLNEGLFALARYKPNGRLDPSFGDHGEVTTELRRGDGWAYGIAIDSKGRIIAAGIGGIEGDFTLIRYEPNGHLDRSFGTNGVVMTDFNGAEDRAFSVGLDSHDRIVAAGEAGAGPAFSNRYDFALARYDADGHLDPTFGDGGKSITDFGTTARASSIAIGPRDDVVAAGRAGRHENLRFALARYGPDGALEPSFGSGGTLTTRFEGSRSTAAALAIDSQARIVAAGRAARPGHRKFAVARYQPDGRLDSTFSHDGKTITTFGSGKRAQGADAVAVDSKDRIVAAGYAGGKFALARYRGR